MGQRSFARSIRKGPEASVQKNIRETLETLETVKLFGSNISDTPETVETLTTVKLFSSNMFETPETPVYGLPTS